MSGPTIDRAGLMDTPRNLSRRMIDSLRDLKLFVAAYEQRSFTLAAIRENATQSGVSQHIKKIEDRSGVKLFTRQRGKIVSTPAGDAYYRRCLEILRANDAANRTLADFAKSLSGEIFVGLMPTMTRSCLAPTLARFIKQYPNVSIQVEEAYSAILTGRVLSGELDFAIVPQTGAHAGLKAQRFLQTIETIASSTDSPLKHMEPVKLSNVKPLRLVLPGGVNVRRQTLDSYFIANNIVVDQILELDSMMGTLDFIENSNWFAILPAILMSRDVEMGRLTVNPIVEPVATIDLMLIEPARKTLSRAASEFLDILKTESLRQNAVWDPWMRGFR
jgi:LysR family nitrogen assimilation transcriptional regulator